jgi:hypothetical protein
MCLGFSGYSFSFLSRGACSWTLDECHIFVNDRPPGHLQIHLLVLLKICGAVADFNSSAAGGNIYDFTSR